MLCELEPRSLSENVRRSGTDHNMNARWPPRILSLSLVGRMAVTVIPYRGKLNPEAKKCLKNTRVEQLAAWIYAEAFVWGSGGELTAL